MSRGAERLPLSQEETRRYGRHLVLPEVGREGQERLKAASVLVVGVGALGSPASLYLTAAGVGRIGLVDFDEVEESNLHRQVLFSTSDIGRSKLEVARERLTAQNPHVEITPHAGRLTSENALDVLEGYEVVLDASDNFPTRYLINDACVLTGKPDVYGAIHRFEGQVGVFWGAEGACYRCLFDRPPPPELAPDCATAGVMGVLPGTIGCLQATEAIKLLLGRGAPLVSRLLVYDALGARLREVRIPKNPECLVCSANPTQVELIDYEEFCGSAGTARQAESIPEMTAGELARRRDAGERIVLLDVRSPVEYEIAHLDEAILIPLPELPDRVDELPEDAELAVHCHHGPRGQRATRFLREQGWTRVWNVAGGIDAWSREVDPSVPRY